MITKEDFYRCYSFNLMKYLEKYNIKFIPKGVQSCANGSLKTYHGLQFKHITREEYLQYKMIEDNIEVVKGR